MIETIVITIQDFLALGIIATALSVLFQWFKTYQEKKGQKLSSNESKAWIILLSLLIASAYFFVRETSWFVNFVEILTIASTVFSLLFKKSEEATK